MSPIRVVIIEDHTLTRMGLRGVLEEHPQVEITGEAADGKEGLRLLLELQPTVVVVDLGLPYMDGIELVQRFRAAQTDLARTDTKVLILTMQDRETEVLAAFAAGADSYCVKDTEIEQTLEAVLTTAEGQSWIDPVIAGIVLKQMRNEQSNAPFSGHGVMIHGLEPDIEQMIQIYPLTDREIEVLELMVEGQTNAAIAASLFLSLGTVKTHVCNILSKLCASDRTEAAVRALRSGLVQ
ncbi:MAG: response regulator transcription factor [Acaryochloridaceae cyanobacterium CSU_3_4]|nr:response regulator transcription factor [Acaryochloridaceae cyanobacterium CSU_3_4]